MYKISKVKIKGKDYYSIQIYEGVNKLTGKSMKKTLYGVTRKALIEKVKEYEREISEKHSDKFGDCFKVWLKTVQYSNVKSTTYSRYVTTYNHITSCSRLYATKLDKVDNILVKEFINSMRVKNSTKKLVLSHLKAFFNYCIAERKITFNPCTGVKVHSQSNTSSTRYISLDEQKEFIGKIKGTKFELEMLLCLLCGMRIGEVRALTINDIDLDKRTINIDKSASDTMVYSEAFNKPKAEVVVSSTKSVNSTRVIFFSNDYLYSLINSRILEIQRNQARYKNYAEVHYLCAVDKYGGHYTYNTLSWHIKKYLPRYSGFHDLRHTFASNAINAGIPLEVVSRMMGHSSIQITLDIYGHINEDKKRQEIDKLEGFYSKIF